ncbi:hypothetical protein ACFSCX_06950 [Bacillus salitolerans]|uniref:DUF5590 domain-containing protein n=1 Tax=Bacillus salitolerans TaxID=1437434 RepID=A0ABW4LP51_9BACI
MALILIASVFIFIEVHKKLYSYSTPEEALRNISNPKAEAGEVVETRILEETNTAYIVFYPLEDDMVLVARFNRNKYGWKYADMIGLGPIETLRKGDYVGSKDFYMGGTMSNVSKVKLGTYEAELILLEGTSMQVWILHNTTKKYFKSKELLFLDKEGNKL